MERLNDEGNWRKGLRVRIMLRRTVGQDCRRIPISVASASAAWAGFLGSLKVRLFDLPIRLLAAEVGDQRKKNGLRSLRHEL